MPLKEVPNSDRLTLKSVDDNEDEFDDSLTCEIVEPILQWGDISRSNGLLASYFKSTPLDELTVAEAKDFGGKYCPPDDRIRESAHQRCFGVGTVDQGSVQGE